MFPSCTTAGAAIACALAVANALGVAGNVRYLHNLDDTLRAVRTAYSVRSRLSAVGGLGKTVGAIRAKLAQQGARYYIVHVQGHVLLLGADGSTLIDTNPRKHDRRKIRYIYGVFPKPR